jgi:hypothetical protein
MKKFHIFIILGIFILSLTSSVIFSQDDKPVIYDNFSKKDLAGWISGGSIDIKYSHNEDNAENGYGIVYAKTDLKAGSYMGKLIKYSPVLFGIGNYITLMVKGVLNDVNFKFGLLYDIDNNGVYNDDKDILLLSKPISLNFDDWKQVKIKLDEENFKIISHFDDNFTVAEEEAIGVVFEFETGKNFKTPKFESGIAMISEIFNKENITANELVKDKNKDSYFNSKNYPNPFNPSTTISYVLPNATHVRLTVYDRIGREVKVLLDDSQSEGTHTVDFNGTDLPSGIYFYRIKTSEKTEVKKMILAK